MCNFYFEFYLKWTSNYYQVARFLNTTIELKKKYSLTTEQHMNINIQREPISTFLLHRDSPFGVLVVAVPASL